MSPSERSAILVLGMHRAGTSAVTRVLNLLGAELGDELLPPREDNPSGFWEHAGAVAIHERLLQGLHRSWLDTRGLPDGWAQRPPAAAARQEIAELIERDFDAVPLWALKDPRLSLFAPLWLEELDRRGIGARVVIVVRHPEEVAASLFQRERRPRGSSLLLWLQYLVAAELASRGRARVLLPYDDLLSDWRDCAARMSSALQLDWPRAPQIAETEIDAFLDGSQRHHRSGRDSTPSPLVQAAWDAALVAACDPAGWETLGQIGQRYMEAAPSFVADIDAWVEHAFHIEGRALHAERLLNGYIANPDVLAQHTARLDELQSGLDAATKILREQEQRHDSMLQTLVAQSRQVHEVVQAVQTVLPGEIMTLPDRFNLLLREVTTVQASREQAFAELSAQVRAAQNADGEAVRQAVAALRQGLAGQAELAAALKASQEQSEAQTRAAQSAQAEALSAQIEALAQQLAALQQFISKRGLFSWLRRRSS